MEIAALVYFGIALALVVYMLVDSPFKIASTEFVILLGICLVWPITILAFLLDPE